MNLEKLDRGDLSLMHIAVYQHIRHMEEWIREYSELGEEYKQVIQLKKSKKKRMENLAIRLRKAIRKVGDSRDISYI